MSNIHKCIIVGSGPAGYTAAIYASRAGLEPIIIEGSQPGGQLTTTTEVDNFPGYPEGIDGTALMNDLKAQAERFGTKVIRGFVNEVDFSGNIHKLIVDGETEYLAKTVIISTGATAKYLGIKAEKEYAGMGVSACATCDGFFYRKKKVAVVGGGDTACEEASYLAGLAEKVYMIVRKDHLRASKAMQDRVNNIENIEILYKRNAIDLFGDNGVEGAVLAVNQGEENEREEKIDIDGFFLAIGHSPNTKVFKDYINTNEEGYILTNAPTSETNVKGVFACGDVQDFHYRQAITAAGSGCKAAMDAERYIQTLNH